VIEEYFFDNVINLFKQHGASEMKIENTIPYTETRTIKTI